MPFIEPELLKKAREMDLLTYLQRYEPQELKHVRGDVYCTQSHDSLKISNGKWMWWSKGFGGQNALDYLVKVQGLTLPQAAERILGVCVTAPMPKCQAQPAQPKVLLLPLKDTSNVQAANYLARRKIAPEVVRFCIDSGRLYQEKNYGNLVFVGSDSEGTPRYANLRGTMSDFKGEATGSDKRYSFSIPAKEHSDTVHLFESAIDALSFATLLKMYKRDWREEHLLSLAGIYQPSKDQTQQKLPVALQYFLENHPEINTICLRLDNDMAGRGATQALQNLLSARYTVKDKPSPSGKDYNEYLQTMAKTRSCGQSR